MTLGLHNLKPNKTKKKKRLGRGDGSGDGNYSGRGIKGQKARSGGKGGLKVKGMKARIASIPKRRGFKTMNPSFQVVNVSDLEKHFDNGQAVTPEVLKEKRLIDNTSLPVKVLGDGDIKKSLTITGCKVSKSAGEKIKAAGGTFEA